MLCPMCNSELVSMTTHGVSLDVCKNGCGGLWLDQFELKKLDEQAEPVDQSLLDLTPQPDVRIDYNKRLNCPKCKKMVMMQHFFSIKHKVRVDECPGCAGYWLDAGELKQIRSLFKSDAERIEATEKAFSKMFDPILNVELNQAREEVAKARKVANMLRFICPSNYIPGKQKWGSF